MSEKVIYVFGKPGTGKTIFSDEIEKRFLLNPNTESVHVDDSNLKEVTAKLDQLGNVILVVQSNLLTIDHVRIFRKFVEKEKFDRLVVIQSDSDPDSDYKDLCEVYETGYPYFAWVYRVSEKEWKAKSLQTGKVWNSFSKDQAIELARNYKTNSNNRIYKET